MDSPYTKELHTAIAAVQHAAALTRRVLAAANKSNASGAVESVSKTDLSPVTVADFAAQALLTAAIRAVFPDDSFVGEETADDLRADPALLASVWDYLQQAASLATTETNLTFPDSPEHACELIDLPGRGVPGPGRIWVFDPVDGTKTFIRGEIYAVNACLMIDGVQTVAVVGLPNLAPDAIPPLRNDTVDPDPNGGSILYAVQGHGSFIRPLVGAPSLAGTLIPQHDPRPSELRLVTSLDATSAAPGVHEKIASRLGVAYPGSDLLGWVARWASLALGHANVTYWVYKRRQRLGKIWDHAGAMLLFQEAGGKVTDLDGKEPNLIAGRQMVANYGWVAAPAGIHADVLKTVREAMVEDGLGHLLL
ncbi:inositol monophosphatase family protein [Plectosphaerella plurivora]|uniref:Inositol monophosphatase family protein n=1 Tax=Plectosphaerella plurivora TaxID=936078 RepID=A0A9P8VMR2_9PEZI|nr:inositol monophosphatase family protein [Plectosphaerella plurivora]